MVAGNDLDDRAIDAVSLQPAAILGEILAHAADQDRPLAQQAQGRLGTPEEVAEMAAFLASDDAAWVNGAYYILDNALTASVL